MLRRLSSMSILVFILSFTVGEALGFDEPEHKAISAEALRVVVYAFAPVPSDFAGKAPPAGANWSETALEFLQRGLSGLNSSMTCDPRFATVEGPGCLSLADIPMLSGDHAASPALVKWRFFNDCLAPRNQQSLASAGFAILDHLSDGSRNPAEGELARRADAHGLLAYLRQFESSKWPLPEPMSDFQMQTFDDGYTQLAARGDRHFRPFRVSPADADIGERYLYVLADDAAAIERHKPAPNAYASYADLHAGALHYAFLSRGAPPSERDTLISVALLLELSALHYLQDAVAPGHSAADRSVQNNVSVNNIHDLWNNGGALAVPGNDVCCWATRANNYAKGVAETTVNPCARYSSVGNEELCEEPVIKPGAVTPASATRPTESPENVVTSDFEPRKLRSSYSELVRACEAWPRKDVRVFGDHVIATRAGLDSPTANWAVLVSAQSLRQVLMWMDADLYALGGNSLATGDNPPSLLESGPGDVDSIPIVATDEAIYTWTPKHGACGKSESNMKGPEWNSERGEKDQLIYQALAAWWESNPKRWPWSAPKTRADELEGLRSQGWMSAMAGLPKFDLRKPSLDERRIKEFAGLAFSLRVGESYHQRKYDALGDAGRWDLDFGLGIAVTTPRARLPIDTTLTLDLGLPGHRPSHGWSLGFTPGLRLFVGRWVFADIEASFKWMIHGGSLSGWEDPFGFTGKFGLGWAFFEGYSSEWLLRFQSSYGWPEGTQFGLSLLVNFR